MLQTIVLGNIITMDEKRPFAKAVLVKDGTFAYIGEADEARRLADEGATVLDYGDNFVYPGFLEAHSHGCFAGYRNIGQANLMQVKVTDYERYAEIIRQFIADNPGLEVYMAAGWIEDERHVTKAYLDEICADKPLIMNTDGGHSCLLNTKALEWAGFDAAYAKRVGYDLVHVDEDGEPDGYVCEQPAVEVLNKAPVTFEQAKRYILKWQDMAFANGFTAVADAGAELIYPDAPRAYHELEEEGRLKLRTFAYLMVPDNPKDPKAEIARIVADRVRYSAEYFHVIGVKAFLDGVIEAHTGWQLEEYADAPGYFGVRRFCDHDKMVDLIVAADAEGLAVHVHSIGDGATHFMLDCIEEAEKITHDLDQRNVLAHLQIVCDEDIQRMASTRSVPAVAPLWTPKEPGCYEMEVAYLGQEMADRSYPIKSFFDAGAAPVFHSDYPVSADMDINRSIYMAETRALPEEELGGMATQRCASEAISREQSLRALTINVAHAWHQESRLGSIEFGKLANMTVVDCDFLHDDIRKVADARIVATIVDGEEVYRA